MPQTPDDEAVIARHFAARDASEDGVLRRARRACRAPAARLPPGGCNDAGEIEAHAAHARPTSCWCSAPDS